MQVVVLQAVEVALLDSEGMAVVWAQEASWAELGAALETGEGLSRLDKHHTRQMWCTSHSTLSR